MDSAPQASLAEGSTHCARPVGHTTAQSPALTPNPTSATAQTPIKLQTPHGSCCPRLTINSLHLSGISGNSDTSVLCMKALTARRFLRRGTTTRKALLKQLQNLGQQRCHRHPKITAGGGIWSFTRSHLKELVKQRQNQLGNPVLLVSSPTLPLKLHYL